MTLGCFIVFLISHYILIRMVIYVQPFNKALSKFWVATGVYDLSLDVIKANLSYISRSLFVPTGLMHVPFRFTPLPLVVY